MKVKTFSRRQVTEIFFGRSYVWFAQHEANGWWPITVDASGKKQYTLDDIRGIAKALAENQVIDWWKAEKLLHILDLLEELWTL